MEVSEEVGGVRLVTKLCPTLATPWTVACQAPLSMGCLQATIGSRYIGNSRAP